MEQQDSQDPLELKNPMSKPHFNVIQNPEKGEIQETHPSKEAPTAREDIFKKILDTSPICKLVLACMSFCAPYLERGGKPSSLILTLSVATILFTMPKAVLGYNGSVPTILAVAAGIVAVRASSQP